MTFSQPHPLCDACRANRHDDCVEKESGWDHDGTAVRVCWCVKCSFRPVSSEES